MCHGQVCKQCGCVLHHGVDLLVPQAPTQPVPSMPKEQQDELLVLRQLRKSTLEQSGPRSWLRRLSRTAYRRGR